VGAEDFPLGKRGQDVEAHPGPKLRRSGTIPPFYHIPAFHSHKKIRCIFYYDVYNLILP